MDNPVFSLIVIIAVGIILILMGIGHIIVGLSLIINAILSTIATRLDNLTYATICNIILIAGAIVGLVIIFYSIIKYNKKDKNTD